MTDSTINRVISILEGVKDKYPGKFEDMNLHPGYVEPGYDDVPVVVGNWNDVSGVEEEYACRLGMIFEKMGLETEWSDEWRECNDCYKIFRIHPDSYVWTPSYVENHEGQFCRTCFLDGASSILFKDTCDHTIVDIPWEVDLDMEAFAETKNESEISVLCSLLQTAGCRYFFTQRFRDRFIIWVDADEFDEHLAY